MKSIATPLISVLALGLLVAVSALARIEHENFGILQGCLAIAAVLMVARVIAMLPNLAIFAPIYWLLGRNLSKKNKNEKLTKT